MMQRLGGYRRTKKFPPYQCNSWYAHNQELIQQLDFEKGGFINVNEFDLNGQASTNSDGDDDGAPLPKLQGSHIFKSFIILKKCSFKTFLGR